MKNENLNLFQKRDEQDELDGFQQQELAKVKHMVYEINILANFHFLENFTVDLRCTDRTWKQTVFWNN